MAESFVILIQIITHYNSTSSDIVIVRKNFSDVNAASGKNKEQRNCNSNKITSDRLKAISNARKEQSGLASGLVNTSYQIGSALGLAVVVALASSQTETLANIGLLPVEALNSGFHSAFIVGAVISVIATFIALVGLKIIRVRKAIAKN